MFLIDFEAGRDPDEEIKSHFAAQLPYGNWLREQASTSLSVPQRRAARL